MEARGKLVKRRRTGERGLLCRVWLPNAALSAGKHVAAALHGDEGANFDLLRVRFGNAPVAFKVRGEASLRVADDQKMHVSVLCKDLSVCEEVVAAVVDLVQDAIDEVCSPSSKVRPRVTRHLLKDGGFEELSGPLRQGDPNAVSPIPSAGPSFEQEAGHLSELQRLCLDLLGLLRVLGTDIAESEAVLTLNHALRHCRSIHAAEPIVLGLMARLMASLANVLGWELVFDEMTSHFQQAEVPMQRFALLATVDTICGGCTECHEFVERFMHRLSCFVGDGPVDAQGARFLRILSAGYVAKVHGSRSLDKLRGWVSMSRVRNVLSRAEHNQV